MKWQHLLKSESTENREYLREIVMSYFSVETGIFKFDPVPATPL